MNEKQELFIRLLEEMTDEEIYEALLEAYRRGVLGAPGDNEGFFALVDDLEHYLMWCYDEE